MKLEKEKVRSEKFYLVGYNPKLKKYILSTVVPWIVWYSRYYEITEEEYNFFGTDELDDLAEQLYREETNSNRFLFSDKNEENTPDQLKLRNIAINDEQ